MTPILTEPITEQPVVGSIWKVNAGFMAPGQTAKQYIARNIATLTTGAVTVALETVTAGKTFYITDIFVTSDAAQTNNVEVRIQAGGVDIWATSVHSLAPIDAPGIETQPFGTSGQVVQAVLGQTSSIAHVWLNVFGFEQ